MARKWDNLMYYFVWLACLVPVKTQLPGLPPRQGPGLSTSVLTSPLMQPIRTALNGGVRGREMVRIAVNTTMRRTNQMLLNRVSCWLRTKNKHRRHL